MSRMYGKTNVAGFKGGMHYRGEAAAFYIGTPIVTYTSVGNIFLYTSANWNTAISFFLEASFRATAGTANVRLFNLTADAAVASSNITSTSSTLGRVRSSALTLVNTNEYQVQVGTSSSGTGAITGAKLIVT